MLPDSDFASVLASCLKHERMDKGLFENFIYKQPKASVMGSK